jgi:AraC family transcriptional regulator
MTLVDYLKYDPSEKPPSYLTGAYVMENKVQFSKGHVAVGKHTWTHPVEDEMILKDGIFIIDIAISSRLTPSKMIYLDVLQKSAPQDLGRIIAMMPGSRVRVTAPAGALRSMHCVLEGSMIETLIRRKFEWDEKILREAARLDGPDLEWLMLRIYRELRQPGFASELMVEELTNAVCIELVRRLRLDQSRDGVHRGGLPHWRMRLVRERAYAHAPAPNLPELADLCDLSVHQLCRAFKAETGQTVSKFIEAAMINRARSLLADSSLSVSEIASKVGFATSSSFCHAFRRATGLRPSEVRIRRKKSLRH